ncbi:MAG TPA: DEAD/DEAH box helicase family protein [Candidatus Anaerostipes excrementavium]|uniref:DEAD/DEAH box helicase family protein n=1 Tax=Candidatus Anaerostipes excrementavium TaxID=2838463 RepID=A0A9D2BB11_9FIRM|nr:DEAD/DEAH box helicase family protein [uncultured Anaerostipes sp.]HIX68832.1 DEAD/DEAH box helicase family protein [Candidatus Anaerostipes excrementavium]
MTNFDFLKSEPKFKRFADVAISAEKILNIDTDASALNCRRAMEFALKWMYSVDRDLERPYQDTLYSLMQTDEFKDIVGKDLWKRMDFIRTIGNRAAHNGRKISLDQAKLCLENLFMFLDFVAYCYADNYEPQTFQKDLLEEKKEEPLVAEHVPSQLEIDLQVLIEENKALKAQLTARREEQKPAYVPKSLDFTEYETRKIYIDTMLEDAGWTEGKDWLNEVSIKGMPTKSGTGRADYVLYDDRHVPLAIVEAKSVCKDARIGRQQAQKYADAIEMQYGRRPVIFLTNGFETRIDDGRYPEREAAFIYSKRDLEKWFNLQSMRKSLKSVTVDKEIAGRYYQEAAIRAVCDTFDQGNKRKALLVMATGSGKTRTVIALCKILREKGWIKNILFLADRNSLVTQAKRSFVNLLDDLSVTNLCEEKDNYSAHCVFSTYQTMIHCIDEVKDEKGKLYTCGHFDLVICDEAHRSIYNKYKDIFQYFDAPLVGLTATPKDEVEKNTYDVFELENGVPTYGYDLEQAVKDGYLTDYATIETKLKLMEEGITYSELSEEEKEVYEDTFSKEEGGLPERIDSSELNSRIFNKDTIKKVLHILMTDGLHVQYGETLGKTIIFAKNHKHAEKILEVFEKEYPKLKGYAQVIDNQMSYPQNAIDEFSEPDKLPRIAISVDMLDTGIDVPEILNLVFFKKVMSKSKFWQMIGRGTRLCPNLMDGDDKKKFYIFDFCGNFEFFRVKKNGQESAAQTTLQSSIFNLEFQLSYKLQKLEYQTEHLISYRNSLVNRLVGKVKELNRDSFIVKQHLQYVDFYSEEKNYQAISYEDTLKVKEELAPLILPDQEDAGAVRFDALIYGMELALLEGKKYRKAQKDLINRVRTLADMATIPEIMEQSVLMNQILHTDYLERAEIKDLEEIRKKLRNLMKYIPTNKSKTYDTNFEDEILSSDWHESELESDDLKNYRAKAEFYIRQHQDQTVIEKLKKNEPLTTDDIETLENILWHDIGTREDYEAEYGSKPLGELVREIIGLDMNAAKEAFAEFLNDANLDSRQIYFVNQIVEYIVHNGMMKDFSVLMEPPFTDQGSVVQIFTDQRVWFGIKGVIDSINANASAASI